MKRIDLWTKTLITYGRLYITKKSGWVRIIRILGGDYRFETSNGIDLYFKDIDKAINYIKEA